MLMLGTLRKLSLLWLLGPGMTDVGGDIS
jgi:hypothetical protein